VRDQPPRIHLFRCPGAWCVRRSGIKEEPAGRGTAAEPYIPSARAYISLAPDSHAVEHKQDRRQIQGERNLLKRRALLVHPELVEGFTDIVLFVRMLRQAQRERTGVSLRILRGQGRSRTQLVLLARATALHTAIGRRCRVGARLWGQLGGLKTRHLF
jgi:hypothetical protein